MFKKGIQLWKNQIILNIFGQKMFILKFFPGYPPSPIDQIPNRVNKNWLDDKDTIISSVAQKSIFSLLKENCKIGGKICKSSW